MTLSQKISEKLSVVSEAIDKKMVNAVFDMTDGTTQDTVNTIVSDYPESITSVFFRKLAVAGFSGTKIIPEKDLPRLSGKTNTLGFSTKFKTSIKLDRNAKAGFLMMNPVGNLADKIDISFKAKTIVDTEFDSSGSLVSWW